MTQRMQEIARTIVDLQAELDREIEHRRRALGVRVHDRLVEFERGIVIEQRKLRTSARAFLARSSFGAVISAPVISSMLLPLVLLDIWISVYQAICFRAYRIARAERRDYIAFDRGRLAYLNWVEALNCAYCAYANGVIAYAREIGSRTEHIGARSSMRSGSATRTSAIMSFSNLAMPRGIGRVLPRSARC